jgi:hypothetical protein
LPTVIKPEDPTATLETRPIENAHTADDLMAITPSGIDTETGENHFPNCESFYRDHPMMFQILTG